jgi:hypothetical protein
MKQRSYIEKYKSAIRNACYHSVQNLTSSCLLSQNENNRIQKTINYTLVLCGCETWSLTLREEHRLRVFENRALRRIFGLKGDEVIGGWRKLHNQLHNSYCSPSIIRMIKSRKMRWAGHAARMGWGVCIEDFGGKARRKDITRKTYT